MILSALNFEISPDRNPVIPKNFPLRITSSAAPTKIAPTKLKTINNEMVRLIDMLTVLRIK